MPQPPTCCLFSAAGSTSPGFPCPSCVLWALELCQRQRSISAPSDQAVWGIAAPTLTGKTPAWALSAPPHSAKGGAASEVQGSNSTSVSHSFTPCCCWAFLQGLPVLLLPAVLQSAVLRRLEAASLPGHPAHCLLGDQAEERTTYRFVKPLGPGALHANISCQFFFNFCPQQLQNKAWEDEPGAPWSLETRSRIRPAMFLCHDVQAYFITYGKLTSGINTCAYSKHSLCPYGNWIVREPSEHDTALWTCWIPSCLLPGI